ncbi:FecCD family ABC transporter permease [Actinomyces vulturis]|uniref:FecCD family ABC transporter permease n=1 Tax=Actinomyces vulturis TaxID=1857645 RepID=UPI00082FF4C3|nr:iron ABC transporter permease [Actinomyces vulturis]
MTTLSLIIQPAKSLRHHHRPAVVGRTLRLLLVLLVAGVIAGLLIPSPRLTPADLWDAISDSDSLGYLLIVSFRLPRILLAASVGAAFGCAGSLLQRLLHNPLASPDVMGLNAGASLAAMSSILFLGWSGLMVSVAAFLGAMTVVIVTLAIAGPQTSLHASTRLVLIGVALSALGQALIFFVTTLSPAHQVRDILLWISGSLNSFSWQRVGIIIPILIVMTLALIMLRPTIEVLDAGHEIAQGLGIPARLGPFAILMSVAVLVAAASAAAGPITFVAFVSGPIARWLIHGRHSMLCSALVGSVLVVWCDLIAQILPSGPYPVGVITGALGAPILLLLLLRGHQEAS